MKYTGGGGTFAKFEKPGDRYEGTLVATRTLPNKFQAGKSDPVADFVGKDGSKFTVRLAPTALNAAWEQAKPQPGEYIILVFERTYPSKFGQPGKEISVDIPARDGGEPQAPAAGGGSASPIEAAYAKAVELKGEAAAKQIRTAVESVEKDPAKQAAMLLKAVGA
jgi:hypothetical protein